MSKWIYFSDEETKNMTDDICFRLDRAREFYGYPIVLICGYRTPEHNAEIGGVPNSAHVKGMAADLKAPQDPFMRERMAWAFGSAGFRNVESAPKHFHVATDPTVPQNAFYQGVDH